MKKILLAAILAGAVCGAASATEILSNTGFEAGLSSWVAGNGAPALTSTTAHTGTFAVQAMSGDEIRQNFAAVATSDVTSVSFWAQRNGGPFDLVEFFYSDSSVSNTIVNGLGQGDGWMQFDVTAFLVAGKMLTGFGVYGTSPGPAYLDDFSIQARVDNGAVPEPASLALVGLGLLGFAARRRQK
jgi:hypothetical protein